MRALDFCAHVIRVYTFLCRCMYDHGFKFSACTRVYAMWVLLWCYIYVFAYVIFPVIFVVLDYTFLGTIFFSFLSLICYAFRAFKYLLFCRRHLVCRASGLIKLLNGQICVWGPFFSWGKWKKTFLILILKPARPCIQATGRVCVAHGRALTLKHPRTSCRTSSRYWLPLIASVSCLCAIFKMQDAHPLLMTRFYNHLALYLCRVLWRDAAYTSHLITGSLFFLAWLTTGL